MNDERFAELKKLTEDAISKPHEVRHCDSTYLDYFNHDMTPAVAMELLEWIERLRELARTNFYLYHEAMTELHACRNYADMLELEKQNDEYGIF